MRIFPLDVPIADEVIAVAPMFAAAFVWTITQITNAATLVLVLLVCLAEHA